MTTKRLGLLPILIALSFAGGVVQEANAQTFGRNKVQYKDFTWYFIQTERFDIYFNQEGRGVAPYVAQEAEKALDHIQRRLHYNVNNRMKVVLYTSQNDFQSTNVTMSYLGEGIGGFTELFKNRVVVPFTGDYDALRHVLHHELVHAVMNDMLYGGSIQNVVSNRATIQLPLWFSEGLCEYLSLDGMDVATDMYLRDATVNEYLPDIPNLGGYFAYRGGQSVMNFIAETYGEEKIGEIVNKTRGKGGVAAGIKASIGLDMEELNKRWKKSLKKRYWPEVAIREDPDEFADALTDPDEPVGFFNTKPALSPDGDKIAFISNRDFYFDVYVMDADGENVERIVKGNRTADFEELNILTPGLSWAPDGETLALAAKSGGYDVVYLLDVEEGDRRELEPKFDGVHEVVFSPDGKLLALSAQIENQGDVFLYNIESGLLSKLTDDVFYERHPTWTPDGKHVVFSSDRGDATGPRTDTVNARRIPDARFDLYVGDITTGEISRLTDAPESDESYPVVGPDGERMLFVSNRNGIDNIYWKPFEPGAEWKPVTNSMNGLGQLSLSKDGKKMAFSAMYKSAYHLFMMNNPFEVSPSIDSLPVTDFMAARLGVSDPTPELEDLVARKPDTVDTKTTDDAEIADGKYGDSVEVDFSAYVFGEEEYHMPDTSDSAQADIAVEDNLDDAGNFVVNKYKINFTPDIVYANAGYSTYYGLLGTTVLSFSDMLGDHRLIGMTSLQIDLKNSDYGLSYYYLPNRWDVGISGFHTARFLFVQRSPFNADLFRFRNYGVSANIQYPFDQFDRAEFGLGWLNVSSENLDDTLNTVEKRTFLVPSLGYVHDNTIWGYTAPIDGTRYRFDAFGNPISGPDNLEFYSITGDYRNYSRFWYDYSFAFRLSGGFSNGPNAQRFFLGGISNWINRKWASSTIPVEDASDFAFLSAALPLRGYYYADQIGTRYGLLNMELRFPFIRYLVTGGLPMLFQNILGTVFIDAGAAWDDTEKFQAFGKDDDGNFITKDMRIGTGFGARMFFLYFLLRMDVAWAYNVEGFSKPIYYFSIGADF